VLIRVYPWLSPVVLSEDATANLRELIDELGPALPPDMALAIARGVLARVEDGPFDTPPEPQLAPEAVELEWLRGGTGGVMASFAGNVRMRAVGELLYVMLAGGPLHVAKDRPGAKPRPLAKLRTFLGGGPLPAAVEPFVTGLLEERFSSVDVAIDALDALEMD
jgi:hypothetical protein